MTCDLVHNMCGWFLQFTDGGQCHRIPLGAINEGKAVIFAYDLGFNVMVIWEFEHHVKDVQIPKGKDDFNDGYLRSV